MPGPENRQIRVERAVVVIEYLRGEGGRILRPGQLGSPGVGNQADLLQSPPPPPFPGLIQGLRQISFRQFESAGGGARLAGQLA